MTDRLLRFAAALAFAAMLAAPAAGANIEEVEAAPAPAMFDALVMRPLGLVMLGVSAVLYVPAAGITALTQPSDLDQPYNELIRKPARFVFVDPIGSH